MAKRFLTHIDLTGLQLQNSELINARLETATADPTGSLGRIYYNTNTESIKIYDGTAWVGIGEIVSITNTDNNISISVVDGVATINLADPISVDTTGNAATATLADTATVANSVAENSVALGTDTTGDYVASVGGTDGVSVTGTGEGAAVTIANTDKGSSQNIFKNISDGTTSVVADTNDDTVTFSGGDGITVTANATTDTLTIDNTGVLSVTGTANEIEIVGNVTTGDVQIGLPDSVQITSDLTVGGDLTVNGTTTTLNTTELLVEDNIITLNSGVTGTPTLNAGIEIERGDLTNVVFRWNESTDTWEATTDGTNYFRVLLSGQTTASDISDFDEAAQDAVGGILVDGTTIDFTYDDATPSITAEVILATTSYLSATGGLAVDIATVETKLVTDGFTKKVSADVGNATNTSFAITHGLNTRDVQVQIYDNSSYDTVECDVVRTDANTVTVSFAVAPNTDAYRVVIIG